MSGEDLEFNLGMNVDNAIANLGRFLGVADNVAKKVKKTLTFDANVGGGGGAGASYSIPKPPVPETEEAYAKVNQHINKGVKSLLFLGLGVMFAGMAIERAMKSLLQPAIEVAGIMDIISAGLILLFLPAMMMLMPYALAFLDWVTKLTESDKELIGTLILIVLGVGMLMATIGQFLTLISSLSQMELALTALKTAFGADGLLGSINAVKAALLSPLGILALTVGTIIVGKLLWDTGLPAAKEDNPYFVEGVQTGTAIAQNIGGGENTLIGGALGAGVEGVSGIAYLIANGLLGTNGLLRGLFVDIMAGKQTPETAGVNTFAPATNLFVYVTTMMASKYTANSQVETLQAGAGAGT
jgi:hypothetical protein